MASAIDSLLAHPAFRDLHLARLIPLGDAATEQTCVAGNALFTQFHPADQFRLLIDGAIEHETTAAQDRYSWKMGRIDWRWGAVGWSGFLAPGRYSTTARAATRASVLAWRHEDLAQMFYADPVLAVQMFRIVLDSVRRQFEFLRAERLAAPPPRQFWRPAPTGPCGPDERGFAPSLLPALRRSAFFERFDEYSLEQLARGARLVRRPADTVLATQGESIDGLLVLVAGQASACFAGPGGKLDRFRSLRENGVLAGVPALTDDAFGYLAEATVVTESACWFYEIPNQHIEQTIAEDPEFGRSYLQRHLARLAQLISASRLPKPNVDGDPEIHAVQSLLDQNQTRIAVTSPLHQVPHLLNHRLTVANALSCLSDVRNDGRYVERQIARSCLDLLSGVEAEQTFYDHVLTAYRHVTDAPEATDPARLRNVCDEELQRGFARLNTEILNLKNLPHSPGQIFIINHLACPAYYELPNRYHFSFDTAFVSALLNAFYGDSPIRVVRQSPGMEYGHNLFYSRLGHITVPTEESGLAVTAEEKERMRRISAERFIEAGRDALTAEFNLLICPEGQSQKAEDSPARFFSGAFRLAQQCEREPLIVPIALAGFDRRYKHTKLVASIEKPFRLSALLGDRDPKALRPFLDRYRLEFAEAVRGAEQRSRMTDPVDTDTATAAKAISLLASS